MNKLLSTLLRASISASLTNRDEFTEKITKIIEEKTDKDPEAAARISENITSAMESLNESLLIDQLMAEPQDNSNAKLEKKIDKLIEAIDRLNKNLEK